MKSTTRIQLSAMMFLEFFIWGAWYVTMGTYLDKVLHADGVQVGAAYSAMAIATIISPFFVGMIADRFFNAEKVLGVLHLAGAVLLYYLTTIDNASTFYWVLLLYSLMYAPTLALANSVAFRQMQDPSKEFPSIRVLGTIGWIATGWMIDKVFHIETENLVLTFKIAGIASAVLGLLSFALPKTPPKAKGTTATFGQILGSDAFVLFKDKSFVVFFIASVLICIPLSFYYSLTNLYLTETGMQNVTSNMTFGQFSEAFFILLIPFFFRRLGVKWMIALGMIAWGVRFLFFGYGDAQANLWMLFAGIILHGVCFDFFFVTGQIYTDSKAGLKIQSQAQGMITMATYGIGMWMGTLLSGYVKDNYTANDIVQWKSVWMVPAGIAAAVLVFFIIFFKDNQRTAAHLHAEPVEMV
ncbi:MFS transporter [Panacibacter ginsenosidivorans]|uniref:MFS transporter n=1 Tax=Panacibacter ginsenosidivorans TaxID=1813871 RepID=A0A5B8VBJ8_9BACT|nr:nucleoside permease [Panacibacter ginsenosidivorans]QEC68870.1 MFS transporter [Panacibacter ginsenosidivorans]